MHSCFTHLVEPQSSPPVSRVDVFFEHRMLKADLLSSSVVWPVRLHLSGFLSAVKFYWLMVENKYDCVFVLLITLNCKSLLHVVNFKKNKLFNKIHSPLSHTRLICHKQMRCWIYFEANQITVTLVFCRSPKINRNRNNKKCQQWQMMATR